MFGVERTNDRRKKKLIMAVEVLAESDYDCQACDDRLKLERGCEQRGQVPSYLGDEPIYRCPLKLISPLSFEYVRAFAFYSKGWLPNDKSWQMETKKFLDAMIVIENTKIQIEQKQQDKKAK